MMLDLRQDTVFALSPVLLPLQQFTVSGYLNVQSHFHIEEVLILPKVASHLFFQVADFIFKSAYVVLVVGNFITKLILHFTHLPQQCFILKRINRKYEVFSE